MIYTLTLNPAIDYVMSLDTLKSDDINRSFGEKIYYGGKGINVSVILTELETENKALGFLAGFTGEELERMLTNDGISCDFLYLKSGNTRINVKLKADSEIDINASGPDINNDDIDRLFSKLDTIQSGDYLVLSGSVPKNVSSDIYEKILEHLSERGIKFVVDAAGELLVKSLKYKPFLVKPNHIELGEIFSLGADDDETVIRCAAELKKMGALNVLVSRAESGALLLDENNLVHKAGIAKGKLVNSVGCGDSMLAGFLSAYIKTNDYDYALRLGSACGCATAFSPSLATRKEIQLIFDEYFKN